MEWEWTGTLNTPAIDFFARIVGNTEAVFYDPINPGVYAQVSKANFDEVREILGSAQVNGLGSYKGLPAIGLDDNKGMITQLKDL